MSMRKLTFSLLIALGAPVLVPAAAMAQQAMGSVITDGNYRPLAIESTTTVVEGFTARWTLSAFDADDDALLFALVSDPIEGTITSFDPFTGTVAYQAVEGGSSIVTFRFAAFDGVTTSEPVDVVITVLDAASLVFADGFDMGNTDAWFSSVGRRELRQSDSWISSSKSDTERNTISTSGRNESHEQVMDRGSLSGRKHQEVVEGVAPMLRRFSGS